MNVQIQTAAREDILRQYRYYLIEKDAPSAAERFLDAVQSAVDTLTLTPDMGAPKPLNRPALAGLRSWPVPGFSSLRIYYIHAGNELTLIRVLHGKRDINSLLEHVNEPEESSSG